MSKFMLHVNLVKQKFWLNAMFLLGLILLLAGTLFSSYQFYKLRVANSWLIHTYQVNNALSNTFTNELLSESLARGYYITGDENFINQENKALENMDQSLAEFKKLTRDNPLQQTNANKIFNLLEKRKNHLLRTIQYKKNQKDTDNAGIIKLVKEARLITLDLIEVIQNAEILENNLLQERHLTFEVTYNETFSVYSIVSFITFLMFVLVMILFNNQINRLIISEKTKHDSQTLLNGLINSTQDFIIAIDKDYNVIAINQAYQDEFKAIYSRSIYIGSNVKTLMSTLTRDIDLIIANWERAFNGETFTIVSAFGETQRIIYEIGFNPIYNAKGELLGASHIARNVQQRISEQEDLQTAKLQAEVAYAELKKHDEEIILINAMSNALQAAATFQELFAIIQNYCKKILPMAAGTLFILKNSKNYLESVVEWNSPTLTEKVFFPDQCWALRHVKNYEFKQHEIKCNHIKNIDPHLNYICLPLVAHSDIIGSFYVEFQLEDQTNVKVIQTISKYFRVTLQTISDHIALALSNMELHEALTRRSIRDPLTNLYNRAYLNETLLRDLERAKRQNIPLAVLMLDLDHFKKINDTYGHKVGDLVLQEISKIFLENTREGDVVCRYGGEEFIIMLYESTLQHALNTAEKIRILVTKTEIIVNEQPINDFAISIGIATYPDHSEDPLKLIEFADKALYQSKKTGRNKITVYAPNL